MIFSKPGRRSIFPLLPPYGAQDPNDTQGRIIPLNPDGITPYLGLRARLSQVWINRWTILLLLVLVRVLIAISSLDDDMVTAKRETLSACTSVEAMGSSMASMPHYLSRGVNELTAQGVEHAVNGLESMLTMTMTGVEAIFLFVVNMMFKTYLCLITLAVRGSVHAALSIAEDAVNALNSTVQSIGNDIDDIAKKFESAYNDFASHVNGILSSFGGHIPQLDIGHQLDELQHLQIPSSIDKDIQKLNSSLPTFNEVNNFTQHILREPFELVKQKINDSLAPYQFDRSVLPVPAKKQMTFCQGDNGINDFFNSVSDIAHTAQKVFIAVLVIAATLVCVPVAWQEIRRWRTMKERSQLVRKEAHDPMDVVYIVSRPYSAATGIKAASNFSNSRRQILTRWAIAYATSLPALFVFSLGIAGLFACLCQYILLRCVEKTVPELTAQVGAFADKVVDSLQNASAEWAHDANSAISTMNHDLNDNVFGWVNISTTALNDTLNTFIDKSTGVINDTFGGTPLYEPITGVFNCLIELKVEAVQKGLTWAKDHAHIDFPRLPNDTLSLGAAESIKSDNPNASDSFLAEAGDETSNKISEVVANVLDKVRSGIVTETYISAAVFGLWAVIVLIGFIRALVLFCGKDKNRGDGAGLPPSDLDAAGGVPLAAMLTQPGPSGMTASDAIRPVDRDVVDDEKYGFAGHRAYGSAVKVHGAHNGRGSAYVEFVNKR